MVQIAGLEECVEYAEQQILLTASWTVERAYKAKKELAEKKVRLQVLRERVKEKHSLAVWEKEHMPKRGIEWKEINNSCIQSWYSSCGALVVDTEVPGLTQTLDEKSAKYYGGKFFICETISFSGAQRVAEALRFTFNGRVEGEKE